MQLLPGTLSLHPHTLKGAFINDVTQIYECFRRQKRPIFFQFTAKDNSVFFFRFHKICFSRKSQGDLALFRLGLGKEFPNYRKDLKSGLSQVSFQLFLVLNVLVLHLDSEHFK